MLVLVVLTAWIILSLPVGLWVGRSLAAQAEPALPLSRHGSVPRSAA